MLGAEAEVIDLAEEVIEAVIDYKNELLEIFDREVEIEIPADIALFHIRRDKRNALLIDRIEHVAKLLAVSIDQIVRRHRTQILYRVHPKLVKNSERIIADIETRERQFLKLVLRADRVVQPLFLTGQKQRRIDRFRDGDIARDVLLPQFGNYPPRDLLRRSEQPIKPRDVE